MTPADGWGALSLLPTLLVLGLAVASRRPLESLVAGALFGHAMLSGAGFFSAFLGNLQTVMAEPASVWVALVVVAFGALIGILARSGGAAAFGAVVAGNREGAAGRPRAVLFGALGLGVVTFVDDYLNALAVGSAFRGAADRVRISRARLAYVVDSTAAPVCVLIPASTWTVFLAGLFEAEGLVASGGGTAFYLTLLPFLFYPWCALALVALHIYGVIPALGAMRAAERGAATGAPPAAAALDEALLPTAGSGSPRRPRLLPGAFALPILALPVCTLAFDGDALFGVSAAILLALVLVLAAGPAGGAGGVAEGAVRGMEQMVYPIGIVLASFVLRDVNAALGFTGFVIGAVGEIATPALLPALVFMALSVAAFATGSFWGTYTVALPVVSGLAHTLGAPLPLTLGAMVSAGAFGSHACLYGDSTVLSARSAGCSITEHVRTQLPYALLAAAVATLGFLAAGAILSP